MAQPQPTEITLNAVEILSRYANGKFKADQNILVKNANSELHKDFYKGHKKHTKGNSHNISLARYSCLCGYSVQSHTDKARDLMVRLHNKKCEYRDAPIQVNFEKVVEGSGKEDRKSVAKLLIN